ncbi:MAG: tape measure protein, partial [Psychrobium sp.]
MATTKYIDIKLRTKSAETSADKLDSKMKGLGATVDKTSNSFGVLSKVAAAVGTAIVTGQITRYADAYTSLQNQVRQTTKSTEELTERTADLLSLANRSRAGISSTAEAYTQLTLATEALNLTDERRLRLTETIAKSFTIAGKTQAQAEESTRQLNQAFSSGVLRGQEYNTIIENAPEIFRALQKSTGKTAGELRKLADTGQISSSVLITALDEAASTIDTKFNNSTATMAQNIEVANNNLTEFIGSSTTVQNVMGGLGGAIVTASENISTIASGAVLVSSIFAARLIPSILTYSSSLIANTAAQLTNGTAATKTANVYGVVTVSAARATVATNALTLASRAATGAMALLGGPL